MNRHTLIGFTMLFFLSLNILLFIPFNYCDLKADETDIPLQEDEDDPLVIIGNSNCSLAISSGLATIDSYAFGKTGTTSISISVYLERYYNGSWQLYNSWYHSGGSSVTGSDSSGVVSGTYRVWMAITAHGTNGNESLDVYGNIVGC